jgi:hypothetical protein
MHAHAPDMDSSVKQVGHTLRSSATSAVGQMAWHQLPSRTSII